MIILDTNVISEPLRARPDEHVVSWLASGLDARITAISVGELLWGARRLPSGRRRDALLVAIETTLADHGRVVDYDSRAAREYAAMQESRTAAGHPLSTEDGMIAAICKVHGATLATRNVKDFRDLGITVHDPWGHRPVT